MGMRTGIRHKPPPGSAGAMFSSALNIPNRERCRPCSTPTRGKLCQIQPEPYTKLVERYHVYRLHFAAFAARNSYSFQPFPMLDPMTCYPSITAHSFNILRPLTMHQRKHRSFYSQVISCVAAATPPSPKFESAKK